MANKIDWVILNARSEIHCKRCGHKKLLGGEFTEVKLFCDILLRFAEKHKLCKKKNENI